MNVFGCLLNSVQLTSLPRRLVGKLFQTRGPAAAKHLSPKQLWTRVTEHFLPKEDLREQAEFSEARWISSASLSPGIKKPQQTIYPSILCMAGTKCPKWWSELYTNGMSWIGDHLDTRHGQQELRNAAPARCCTRTGHRRGQILVVSTSDQWSWVGDSMHTGLEVTCGLVTSHTKLKSSI